MARAKDDSNENKEHADDIDLADSCLAKFFENDKVAISSESDLFTSKNLSQSISKSDLITAQHVDALIKFFSLFGLPKSIQSDQGSNFMSGIFQQVMHELKIKQFSSSAYHPESQGALERFHQTLKTMIKTYCFDTEKCWDKGIHLLLFAARESVQESLGFSSFELVFGHTVRGPLKLFKEKFLSDGNDF